MSVRLLLLSMRARGGVATDILSKSPPLSSLTRITFTLLAAMSVLSEYVIHSRQANAYGGAGARADEHVMV